MFNQSLRTGAALAITVASAYAACTFIFWLFPEAAAAFMNFAYALFVMAVWAFLVGMLFGWLQQLARARS